MLGGKKDNYYCFVLFVIIWQTGLSRNHNTILVRKTEQLLTIWVICFREKRSCHHLKWNTSYLAPSFKVSIAKITNAYYEYLIMFYDSSWSHRGFKFMKCGIMYGRFVFSFKIFLNITFGQVSQLKCGYILKSNKCQREIK